MLIEEEESRICLQLLELKIDQNKSKKIMNFENVIQQNI